MELKLSITPTSYLLCSSGIGRANIDSDVSYDHNGFPYIPGKRVKGLLRESMIEVLEIMQNQDLVTIVDQIFGKERHGDLNSMIRVGNFYLADYDPTMNIEETSLSSEDILAYYTTEIQQTALNEKGIAKDKSLRNYRVIDFNSDENVQFDGIISFNSIEDWSDSSEISIKDKNDNVITTIKIKSLFEKTYTNLRYGGTRRNRGFGNIKCECKKLDAPKSEQQLDEIKSNRLEDIKKPYIKVKITSLEPIIIPALSTDKNAILSADVISGNALRGFLTKLYIKNNSEFDEDLFKKLFLREDIIFHQCTKNGAAITPKNIALQKYIQEFIPINLLAEEDKVKPNREEGGKEKEDKNNEIIVTKRHSSYVTETGQNTYIRKSQNFHGSRPNRLAGRSMKGDKVGGIFYYESIDANQTFEGRIESKDPNLLLSLLDAIGSENNSLFGKSRGSQYGKVKCNLELNSSLESDIDSSESKLYYVVATSPIILLNGFGQATPTEIEIQKEFADLKISKSATSVVHVEQYNTMWQSKTWKIYAYDQGSTWKVSCEDLSKIPKSIGSRQDQGFGQLKIVSEEEMKELMKRIKLGQADQVDSNLVDQYPLLERISKFSKEKEAHAQIKVDAIKDALAFYDRFPNKVTSSLIGRMLKAIDLKKPEFETFLSDVLPKKAGEALKSTFLDMELKDYNESNKAEYLKWSTFFKTLRFRNKKEKNKKNESMV